MSTPIERAAKAMSDDWSPDRDPILTAMFRDYATSAMDSIDTDQLADVIAQRNHDPNSGQPWEVSAARAVKNWLTGKDQQ